MQMPTYRVKPGHRFGVGKAKGPGDLVELTTVEAAGFLDKLELVEVTKDESGAGALAVASGEAGTPVSATGVPDATPPPPLRVPTEPEDTTPAPDLPTLWATQAPGLHGRVIEVMLKHQLAPAVVKGMDDAALMALDGVGPTTMRAIREHLVGVA